MKKINEIDLAMQINDATYLDYFDRFKMLSTSLFTWKNLDEIARNRCIKIFGTCTF